MRRANRAFAARCGAGDVDAAIAADDAFHGVLVTASQNREIPPMLERLMPRLRRLERARFGSLGTPLGRAARADHRPRRRRRRGGRRGRLERNWLTLGELLERTFDEDAGQEP